MILISVLIFSVVTGTVFAIATERIDVKKAKQDQIKESWWHDDF